MSAATACSGIQKARNAEVRKIAVKSDTGLLSIMLKKWRAERVDSFVFIIAAARINAPRMKKTASLPKSEKTVLTGRTFKRARSAKTESPVTGSGSAPVTHIVMAKKKIASVFCPCRVSPSGVCMKMRKMLIVRPIIKIAILIFLMVVYYTGKSEMSRIFG
jgi:hypothetical protein